jgi:hypothetical protein
MQRIEVHDRTADQFSKPRSKLLLPEPELPITSTRSRKACSGRFSCIAVCLLEQVFSMIPIENSSTGMLVFLSCGCAAWRHMSHPTGGAALVAIIQPCEAHAHERIRIRAVLKGETVHPWVRQSVHIDPVRAR